MKKIHQIKDLCCAPCGAKIERNINKIKGVNECSINFISMKMLLDINDNNVENIYKLIDEAIKKVEPEAYII